jgi:hypothetical protein
MNVVTRQAAQETGHMKVYSIENNNDHIAVHPSAKEAEGFTNTRRFGSEATLAKLATEWPTSRLVRIWNTLPGTVPVRKFTNRSLAIARIWKSVQKLDGAGREKTPDASDAPESRKRTSHEAASTAGSRLKRSPNRTETILALLKQPGGATLDSIMKATGWQSHSVRGFISGMVRGKLSLKVVSERDGKGLRRYRVEA